MSSGAIVLGLWSIVLQPGQTYSQNVSPGIQITNIAFGEEVKGSDRCVVKMKYPEFENDSDDEDEDEEEEEEDDEDDDADIKLPKLITKEAVLAILRPNVTEQVSVNITLVEDVEVVEFSVSGPNAVHIVGHYVRQEDFDQDDYSDSEGAYDSDDEDIDSELEGGDFSMEGISGMLGEDDDEEDSEAERFEEVKEAPSKKRVAEVAVEDEADESMSSTLSKNQRKKLAKKQKSTDGSAVEVEAPVAKKAAAAVAPVVAAAKKVAAAVAAPVVAAAKKEEPKKTASAPRTLAGGLVVRDSKMGDGPAAKSGKKVSMRYIGTLDSGKVFDSNTKGSPLTFTLGRGEVIKGWDQGILGMMAGGERKLTIPAALAYGKKGTQGIPGGATLNFDVKLISIK